MIGNGVLLADPSRLHMRNWYTDPARHANELSVMARANVYREHVKSMQDDSDNKRLYMLQDQLWQSHAVAVQSKVDSLTSDVGAQAVGELLDLLRNRVRKWANVGPDSAVVAHATVGASTAVGLTEFARFLMTGELVENGVPKVWRDGVKYPTMYDVIFKLIGFARFALLAAADDGAVQSLITTLQMDLDSWCGRAWQTNDVHNE